MTDVKLLPLPEVEAIDNLLSASEQEIKEYAGRAGVSRFPPPETLRGWARVIASARLAIRTALEAAREDSERLDWLWRDSGLEGFVNVDADVYDFAQDVADDNNRDEPSREDYNAGFRRLIDAAIDAARKEVGDE